jgi:hypothetical protein
VHGDAVPLMDGGGIYEFVVTGSFGPVLRSMLGDLAIEHRHTETRLRLTDATEDDLLALLAAVVNGGHQLERVLLDDR